MTLAKNNEGIDMLRDELLHLETIGRLPRMDYKTGNPDHSAAMSGVCAIKARMEADFSRLFSTGTQGESVALDDPCFRLPQPAPQCNPSQIPCCGAGSNSEDAP